MADLEELAGRVEALDSKIKHAIGNQGMGLSAGGQAIAIAMIVTLDLPLLGEVAAALRTQGNQNG